MRRTTLTVLLLCTIMSAGPALAAGATAEKGQKVIDKAVAFLRSTQAKDGSW